MAATDETIWEIEPHTQAKHELLTRYLEVWFPIMASWNSRVLFIDGFAGPGHYLGGEPGSPVLAVDSALKRASLLKKSAAMFMFNESDAARYRELDGWAAEANPLLPQNIQVFTRNLEFADLAQGIVTDRGNRRLVPTFAFVDPFGFKGVPIQLIADLVRDQRSELFILFSFNSVNRWIGHPQQQENMQALFGCSTYRDAEGRTPDYRKEFLATLYEKQLRDVGKFAHVSRFEMIEKNGRTSYFLYHCTRSLKGLEVMRSAMWKIDPERGCQFSDRVAGLESLFSGPLVFDLDKRLSAQFAGQRVPIKAIQEFVLVGTPFALEHLKTPTLKPMLERGEITAHGDKIRRGTFPDRCEVEFPA
ncbi:three-Cys-motif partner protein [Mycobacterium sp. BK558]|nr:three-Cys-motif partner protein [Mycobacterium sp. BK558]